MNTQVQSCLMQDPIYHHGMIYALPALDDVDLDVLRRIADQHERLKTMISHEPARWTGTLRRSSMARAIRGSNTIEGYHATIDQAIGAIANEPPSEYSETWLATKGYRDALTYVMQASKDPFFEFSKQLLKSLHFMMIGHEMDKSPGRWRTGAVYVVNQLTGDTVYEAPDAGLVDGLVGEMVDVLRADEREVWPPLLGAMAHLNLAMIHPFRGGNGRMARALQTLVIARAGMVDPVLCSIEEWLGDNTLEYYQVLASVGRGSWSPQNDCLPWIRFCLKAHHQQAQRIIWRSEEYERIYGEIDALIERTGVHRRGEMALFDACIGISVTNSRYRIDADVSEYVASRDLKRLSEMELLTPVGDGRARAYEAGPVLKEIRSRTRMRRKLVDPYASP